jgi:hypothetical protein
MKMTSFFKIKSQIEGRCSKSYGSNNWLLYYHCFLVSERTAGNLSAVFKADPFVDDRMKKSMGNTLNKYGNICFY